MDKLKAVVKATLQVSLITIIIAILFFLFDSTKPFYHGPISDHFDGKKFHNFNATEGVFSLTDVGRWQFYEFKEDIKKLWPTHINDVKNNDHDIEKNIDNSTLKVTFINHATFLIQTAGLNILTDPLFAKRASPFRWIGPKRYRKPGIALKKLPRIDYIIVSHDHYDHCDMDAIKYLQNRDQTIVIAGLGMKNFLKPFGINCQELDWWEQHHNRQDNSIKINFVPAIHWSGRYGLLGNNRTLWGGYVLESVAGNIYFSGDTAYEEGKIFKDIHTRFPHLQYTVLPIGAYEPRWFMKKHHINPVEAVYIHKILKPKYSIAAHFGCLALSIEGEGKPEAELSCALRQLNLPISDFLILKHGESHKTIIEQTN